MRYIYIYIHIFQHIPRMYQGNSKFMIHFSRGTNVYRFTQYIPTKNPRRDTRIYHKMKHDREYIYIHIGTAINQGIEMQIGGYTMLCNIPWCSTPSIIILCIMCTYIYIYMPICSGLRMYNIYTQNHPTADGWNRVKPWEGDGMTISVLFCGLWHVMNPIQSWYFSNCN